MLALRREKTSYQSLTHSTPHNSLCLLTDPIHLNRLDIKTACYEHIAMMIRLVINKNVMHILALLSFHSHSAN